MKAAQEDGKGRRGKPTWQQGIALERIEILFGLASVEFGEHPERSHRYVALARKIGTRYNVKIPKRLKRSFCKHCHRYLVPGRNCTVRSSVRTRSMEMKCLDCGGVSRYPYAREKKG